MTVTEIRELIDLVLESGIAELEVQRGDNKVRIRRTMGALSQEILLPQGASAATLAQAAAGPAPGPTAAGTPPPAPVASIGARKSEVDEHSVLVKSPIVGTYYEAPSPGAQPFVKVGDTVQPGQVLCIIESMKLMNEIEAEVAGVVLSKLVPNGHPVEYGEALFALRPL